MNCVEIDFSNLIRTILCKYRIALEDQIKVIK